jgi:hypothetical protein
VLQIPFEFELLFKQIPIRRVCELFYDTLAVLINQRKPAVLEMRLIEQHPNGLEKIQVR